MHDDEIPVRNNRPRLIFQDGRNSFNEVEQPLILFGRLIVPLVEQCVEGLEYQRLAPPR
jgi:hypothetical protein